MTFRRIHGPSFAAYYGGKSNITVVDSVTDDMLYLVDDYWYQFAPINPLWHGILGIFITIIGIISLIGNFLVLYIFLSTKSLRTPSNLFVINLTISDFLMMFTMFPPIIINCYYEKWFFGPLMCNIYGMCGSLFGCVSIWSMTMIAFDRYNVIVKGFTRKKLTVLKAIGYIFFVWSFSLLWTIAPMFGWNRYVPEGNLLACGTDYLSKDWISRSYIIFYGYFVYFLPLTLIIRSYYYIVQAVTKHEKTMKEQAKKMNVTSLRTTNKVNVEAKLAKVALVTISLWFFAWTPYLLINFGAIFDAFKLSPVMTIWGSVFAKFSTVYNPIVYAISHPRYKAALYKKFPSLDCSSSVSDLNEDVISLETVNNSKDLPA